MTNAITSLRIRTAVAVGAIVVGHLTVGLHAFATALFTYSATVGYPATGGVPGNYGGQDPGQLWYPSGLAIGPQDRIYVADSFNNRVQIFNADGVLFANFGTAGDEEYPDLTPDAPGEFSYPTGVVVDGAGSILVTDQDNHRLQLFRKKVDLNGNQIVDASGNAQFEFVKSVGRYYDAYDPASDPALTLSGFNYPVRAALRPGTRLNDPTDTAGRVAVTDSVNHRVVVFNAQLVPLFAFGTVGFDGNGPAEMDNPVGIGMDSTRIYVADSENHRIQIFDQAGNILSTFGSSGPENSPGDLDEPNDVQPDAQGRLLIADRVRSRVLVLTLDPARDPATTAIRCSDEEASIENGRCGIVASNGDVYDALVVGGFAPSGNEPGRFTRAQAAAMDSAGRLVVLDTEGHRVQIFRVAQIRVTNVTLSPAGPVQSGQTVTLGVTVANEGGVPLLVAPQVTANLAGTLTTPPAVSVSAGSSVTFNVPFVTDANGQLTFTVKGIGTPPVGRDIPTSPPVIVGPITVNPAPGPKMSVALALGTIAVGAIDPRVGIGSTVPVQVTITNTGTSTLTDLQPSVTPAGPGTVSAGPPPVIGSAPLVPGASRSYVFSFTATGVGRVTFTGGATAKYEDLTLPGGVGVVGPTGTPPTASVTIDSDVQPPVTTVVSVSPNVAPSGWYLQRVTIVLSATDNTAVRAINYSVTGGVQPFTGRVVGSLATVEIPFDGTGILVRYWAEDQAGNLEAQKALPPFQIDTTPPTISVVGPDPAPNAAGWINRYPNVRFSALDKLGQVTPPLVPVTTDGANLSVVGTARDLAGNTAQTTAIVNVDTKAPALVCAPTVQPTGLNGWFKAGTASVTVRCDALDQSQPLLSGIAVVRAICPAAPAGSGIGITTPPQTGTSPKFGPTAAGASCTISAEGIHAVFGEAVDVAGNLTATPAITIKIDRTAPTVTCGTASGGEIWPPNHKMVPWNTSVLVTDLISGSAGFKLTAFSSSEAVNWKGDGNTNVDMTGWTIGTPDVSGFVRAERSGTGTGRIYRLLYEGMDNAGNTTQCTSAVIGVPHDQGKK